MVFKIFSGKWNLSCYAISVFIIFAVGSAESATYYVDVHQGNDRNPGTLESPWASIEKANLALKAGDTVYLREGEYKEQQILPKNSGEPDRLITYKSYKNERVSLTGARIPVYLENKKYIQIDGFTISNCSHFFVLYNGASHNIIRNCTFYNAKSYFGSVLSRYYRDPQTAIKNKDIVGASNDFNRILNNVWLDAPDRCSDGPDQNCGTAPEDMHYCEKGRYNVYEGNQFGSSSHDNLVFGGSDTHHNIIRNNLFRNTFRRGLNMYSDTHFNLVEKNRFYDHGLKMASNPIKVSRNHEPWNPSAIQCFKGCSNIIVRQNIFNNNGTVLGQSGKNMYFYSNTADGQLITIYGEGGNYDFKFNQYKNNIFSNTSSLGWPDDKENIYSWYTYVQSGYVMEQNTISHNMFTGDNTKWRYNSNKTYSYYEAFEGSSKDIYANKTEKPSFVNSGGKDFRQNPDSVSIDAGGWLTTITSPSGNNQISFTVQDAGFFFDGWGISLEDGDIVKTANGKTTKIIKIDYDKNRIFVDPAIDTIQGEGLSLTYSGLRPDIGAFESNYTPSKKLNAPRLRLN